MKDWLVAARANPLFLITLWIGVGIIALDQATKLWILHGLQLQERPFGHLDLTPFFDLTYVENRGVSFGLLAGGIVSRIGLTILALVVAGFVLHWAGRLNRRVAAIGAGLIIGGAIGNAIDRTFYGYVVDFLDFSSIGFPWKFNFADTAINLGVACLAYDAFFVVPKLEKHVAAASGAATTSTFEGETPPEANQSEGSEPFAPQASESITPTNTSSRSAE